MSEQLLNQQVAIIYWLWKEAIMLNANGESYEALKTLSYITSTVYDDGTDDPHLKCVDNALKKIEAEETGINVAESQARSARLTEHRNREAANLFQDCLKEIRAYMQKVGYYMMMKPDWVDLSKGRKSK
jgi:hypothetical protein